MLTTTVQDIVALINPNNDVKFSCFNQNGKKKVLSVLPVSGKPDANGVSIDVYFNYQVSGINAAGYMLTELYIY